MKILDCETLESTYKSVEIILGLSKNDLKSIFNEIDAEGYEDFDEQLFRKTKLLLSSVNFESVCWFHLTRAGEEISFHEGILPLYIGIGKIWDYLYTLLDKKFSEDDWRTFKNEMINGNFSSENNHCSHSQYLYKLKTRNQYLGGPYAILVREIAFNSKQIGNHDYLKIPEIVEDICVCFQYVYGFSLVDRYLNSTRPCIVKFVSNTIRDNLLAPTLYYLYCKNKGFKLSLDCNTCFDGAGNIIPKENILQVNWIE